MLFLSSRILYRCFVVYLGASVASPSRSLPPHEELFRTNGALRFVSDYSDKSPIRFRLWPRRGARSASGPRSSAPRPSPARRRVPPRGAPSPPTSGRGAGRPSPGARLATGLQAALKAARGRLSKVAGARTAAALSRFRFGYWAPRVALMATAAVVVEGGRRREAAARAGSTTQVRKGGERELASDVRAARANPAKPRRLR